MSYIGNEPPDTGAYGVQSFDGGGTSFTLSKPSTTATVLLFIDGVRQTPVDAYSVSGVTLTTTATTPSGTDNVTVQFLGDVVDFGEPSDDSVSTAKIQDDAVTADKLANSINTEIAANTAKVTNATHTGDVTGATALTIANDAVDIAMLSATGTADATTYLRGDNSWTAVTTATQTCDYVSVWRMTSTVSGSADPVLNWAEQTDQKFDPKGYGSMTETSGIWSFPTTGFWLVQLNAWHDDNGGSDGDKYVYCTIHVSTNTGADYLTGSYYQAGWNTSNGDQGGPAQGQYIFDVTSTTTHLVKAVIGSNWASIRTRGGSGWNETYFTFTRLGDT